MPPEWYTRVVHMILAMARPWKHPKTGVYWFRRRVPARLLTSVGKREEKRSLRTKDLSEAKARYRDVAQEIEDHWLALEQAASAQPTVTLTQKQIMPCRVKATGGG